KYEAVLNRREDIKKGKQPMQEDFPAAPALKQQTQWVEESKVFSYRFFVLQNIFAFFDSTGVPISLSGCDARIFCVGVRIVKRRTLHQILNMIPKEAEGEHFEDALARVGKCVGGGAATENADSDSDIEVVADFVPVNLRCPVVDAFCDLGVLLNLYVTLVCTASKSYHIHRVLIRQLSIS
ncbi:hypothetical protein Pfo_013900, partial [Paulownia fortunei]